MSNPKRNDNDISDHVIIIDDVTPVEGVPTYLFAEDTPDTAKILISDVSAAIRIDSAYQAGSQEGYLRGQIKILEVAHAILIRAGNSEDEANNIIKIIAKHAGVLDSYNHYLLTQKNNY